MTVAEYNRISYKYEQSIALSKKKSDGVFYTDLFLAEKIIKELSINEDATIVDPCCGIGSFIYAAMRNGNYNLYGADIDKKAIDLCKTNIIEGEFIYADSIETDIDNFLLKSSIPNNIDYVIGNPPYGKWSPSKKVDPAFHELVVNSGNNLFVAALIRAIEMVKSNGIISYIIPKNFLHVSSYSLLRKQILETTSIISIIDIGAYFKTVRGEQIILTIKKSLPQKNHLFLVKELKNKEFDTKTKIKQDFFQNEILLFKNELDFTIYNKLSSFDKLEDLCSGYVGRGRSQSENAVTGKDIRKFGFKNRPLPRDGKQIFIQNIYSVESGIIASFGGTLDASQTVTIFTDGEARMCHFILGFLHSRLCNFFLYKYCYNTSKLTMHTDAKYLNKIPLPKINESLVTNVVNIVALLEKESYMSKKWFEYIDNLNDIVSNAYDLDKVERDYLDREIKSIQSKKWIQNELF